MPLVLLHGMAGDGGLWDPFVSLWAQSYRGIALDLPGHGAAEHVEPGLVPQLRGVRDVLDVLGLRELVLVGHSMGTLPALLCRSPNHEVIRSIAIEPSLDVAGFASTLSADGRVPDSDEEFLA